MGRLNVTDLAIDLALPLTPTKADLAPSLAAQFVDATFTNASDRSISYGRFAPSVTDFPGGTLAQRIIQGRRFAQIEAAATNVLTYSKNFEAATSDWGNTRVTVSKDATTAPDGTSEADKLVEDSTTANSHFASQSHTPDGASQYVYSVYSKADGRDWVRIGATTAGYPGSPAVYFNVSTGVVGTAASVDDYGIEDAGGGWFRIWIVITSDAAASTGYSIYLAEADNDVIFDGDGTSGVYLWGAQLEIGAYPSSPIETVAAAVTRAKDQLHWPSASVPQSLRGRITLDWIPQYNSTIGEHAYLFDFEDNGASPNVHGFYRYINDKIRIQNVGVATLVESNALTFSRGQKMSVTIDPVAGSVTVQGATVGNGTVTGTPWATTAGNVWWGMNKTAASQADGLITEPY
ncbi:MAG: phage head spike fiber domain-containing protein [Planctomycetota bacterium]|jgi:hypothetical protein